MPFHEETMNPDGVPLIDEYLRWLEFEQCARPRTVENHTEVLRRADRELLLGLEKANADELKKWLYYPQRRTRSAASIATYYGPLGSFYRWAFDPRDPRMDGVNPWVWMPDRPKTPRGEARPVTDEQLRRILAEAVDPFRLWTVIAAYQGLRCCEIAGLDREHVTAERLYVAEGKGGKPRWHDTDPYVWEAVKDLPPGPLAVDWRTGERATARFVSRKTARYFRDQLGMPGVALHRMRHWLGVTVCDESGNVRAVQEMLGHDELSSTQIYTRATVKQQRATRALLPRLAG